MNNQIIDAILAFMGRANLSGQEAQAYLTCVQVLESLRTEEEAPVAEEE